HNSTMKRSQRKAPKGKRLQSKSAKRQPEGKREDPAEDEIVRRLAFAGLPGRNRAAGLRLGMGDDAALSAARFGYETVLTCDWFLEGMHFLRAKHPPDSVGWKCLARAVSDIAAMGGEPRCFLLGLALPASASRPGARSATGVAKEAWLDSFLAGLRRAQARLGCVLAGGDTTRSE